MTQLAETYLELNMLLAVVFILFTLLSALLRLTRFEAGAMDRLRHYRAAFIISLIMPLLFMAGPLVGQLPRAFDIPILDVVAGSPGSVFSLSASGATLPLFGQGMTLPVLLTMVAVLSVLAGCLVSVSRWLSLKKSIAEATVLRRFSAVEILVSESASTPFSTRALGRNQIVLPYELVARPGTMRITIRHELQHIRNGDLNWVLLMELLTILCFWNPFVRLWQNRFDCLQEYACDAALMKRGDLERRTYGNCLLDVAARADTRRVFAASCMVPRFSWLAGQQHALTRRITLLGKKDKRFRKTRAFVFFCPALAGILLAAGCVFDDADVRKPERQAEYLPLTTVAPRYPVAGLRDSVQGWVLAGFTVNEAGNVVDAKVIDSCAYTDGNENNCREEWAGLFDENTLDAVRQFTFEPRQEGGRNVRTEGVRYVLSYKLSDD